MTALLRGAVIALIVALGLAGPAAAQAQNSVYFVNQFPDDLLVEVDGKEICFLDPGEPGSLAEFCSVRLTLGAHSFYVETIDGDSLEGEIEVPAVGFLHVYVDEDGWHTGMM